MTLPRDLRDAPRHVVQQEIRGLDDYTINQAIQGYGGPKITPGQESTLRSELNKRRQDDMYAAKLADEARQSNLEPDSVLADEPLNSLQQGLHDPQLDTTPVDPPYPDDSHLSTDSNFSDRTTTDAVDTALSNQGSMSPNDSTNPDQSTTPIQDRQSLSEDERKALKLIGALLIEAVSVKRTRDTIREIINASDEMHLFDPTVPKQLTSHLWETYETAERIQRLNSILDGTSDESLETVLELCDEIGIDIS